MAYHALLFVDFDGNPITGLSPEFLVFQTVATNEAVEPPDIEELGSGFYRFLYEPFQSYFFVIDGGDSIADQRVRYVRSVLEPNQAIVAQVLDEVLLHLRGDLTFEKLGNDTFMVLKKDGVTYRKWKITDHLNRPVDWPDSSRLPVNRQRVL